MTLFLWEGSQNIYPRKLPLKLSNLMFTCKVHRGLNSLSPRYKLSAFLKFVEFKGFKLRMGTLWSCCCGGESEGIATEPLLSNPEVYVPSNLPINQYNNTGNITSSHNGSGDGPERTGSLRQIG